MRISKISAAIFVAFALTATVADAKGIGRSSSIGSSVGVRKSYVTNSVKTAPPAVSNNFQPKQPVLAPSYAYTGPPESAPVSSSPNTSAIVGTIGGVVAGAAIGSMLSSNSNETTVPNTTKTEVEVKEPSATNASAQAPVEPIREYNATESGDNHNGKGIIYFVIFATILLVIAYCVGAYILSKKKLSTSDETKSNGVPFDPEQRFWDIQSAYSQANLSALKTFLSDTVFSEIVKDLAAGTVDIFKLNYEIVMCNDSEFSVQYNFIDDGVEENQVWHYEKFASDWKLVGIEAI